MPEDLTVLIIGAGGREHAISDAYERSARVRRIIVAPGNDFIGYRRQKEVMIEKNCDLKNADSIIAVAEHYCPDLIDIAQDDALATHAADILRERFRVFAPSRRAARIEWDKVYAQAFKKVYGIPAPWSLPFYSEDEARVYADQLSMRVEWRDVYVKAAGLCAGKGALHARSVEELFSHIERMKTLGDAGKKFLIEDALVGREFSLFAISDGTTYRTFSIAKDNKRVFDNDQGDQTGGMGATAPSAVTVAVPSVRLAKELVEPAIYGMRREERPYLGILYVGGILVNVAPFHHEPYVLEYNARWGDPEAQVIIPGIKNDYAELVSAAIDGKLHETEVRHDGRVRVSVAGAARGYPGDYRAVQGKEIRGLPDAMAAEGVKNFGAGIAISGAGTMSEKFYANGGRLFHIVGEGRDIAQARERAYGAMEMILVEGDNLHYRTDIGWQ